MVVGGSHADKPAGFAVQPFHRHMVQQVLQRTGEGRPKDRRSDEIHIRRNHTLHHRLRVIVIARQGTPVGKGNAVVAQVQRLDGRRIRPFQP